MQVGPEIDLRVRIYFAGNVSLSADSKRARCQLMTKIQVKCLSRLVQEECGYETDRPDMTECIYRGRKAPN